MTRGHYSRPKRSLALALAFSMLMPCATALMLPVAASAQTAAPTSAADLAAIQMPTVPPAEGPIHTILMFPFANRIDASAPANGFNADIVGARVENAIKMRLNVIGRYKADSFSPTLPQMQRAVQESGLQGLSETDIAPPYDSSQKGRKLADQVATDGYLLGTIESIQTNAQTRTVSLVISATLYNTETGQAVKALAATGRGISYNTVDDPAALMQSAINDAAGKVVSALNADTRQGRQAVVSDVRPHHKSNVGTIVLGVLIAAAIAIGITASHHSSHNSGGTTTTTTTTPPVTVIGGNPPSPPTTSF